MNINLSKSNKKIIASLDLPGSKSIANRVLPLAAMASGTSIIHNVPDVSEDVSLMLEGLKLLGIEITKIATAKNGCSSYKIIGCHGVIPNPEAEVFLGNSGTSIRFLTAMLALQKHGKYHLTGIQRMKERPIKDLGVALEQVGVKINYLENKGYPPLVVGEFEDNEQTEIQISGSVSSQFLTGLLMALPSLKREVSICIIDKLISKPYVSITTELLTKFGIEVKNNNDQKFTLMANNGLQAIPEYTVEPDASSASYFQAMGAINGEVTINSLGLSSLQGDKNFATVLAKMGADVVYHNNQIKVCAIKKPLQAININMEDMPDVAMTIAVLAMYADGTTNISGISSWKVKETDRILAMYNELVKLGAVVNYTNDSISITPPSQIKQGVAIDTYNDHRMAMCFSLLAVMGNDITINNYECVGKTFANYFEVFKGLVY